MTSEDRTTILVTTIISVSVVFGLAGLREGWMDEFVSHHFTDPSQSASALYDNYWSIEPHAPTYYFLLWEWRTLVVLLPDLFAIRLFSVLVSFGLAAGAIYIYDRLVRRRLSVFTVFLLSAPALLYFSEEARSYILSLFGGVYLCIMFLAALETDNSAKFTRLVAIAVTGAIGSLLCSVHLVSVVFAAFIFVGLTLIAAWLRLWPMSLLAAALTVLTILPAAASTLMLTSGVQHAIVRFWITRRDVAVSMLWLPAFVGLPSLVLTAAVLWNRSLLAALYKDPSLRPAFYALGTAFAFLFVGAGLTLLKPLLTIRYLTAWVGFLIPAAAMIAEMAVRKLGPIREKIAIAVVIGCFTANTAAALMAPHYAGAWRAPGMYVQSLPACRNAMIPVALLSFVPPQREMDLWTYMFAWYAGEPGRFVPANEENLDRAAKQSCSIRLWAAHLRSRYLSDEVLTAFQRTCRREAIEVLQFDSGYLFVAASDRVALDRWTGSRTSCSAVMKDHPTR